jgi:hypothetical protein
MPHTGDVAVRRRQDLEALRREAAALGHRARVNETKSGRRFEVSCTCGYGVMPDGSGRPAVTRATLSEALGTAQWHLEGAVTVVQAKRRRDGLTA